MSDDSPIKVPSLDKYRITMTKEQVAEVLNLPTHIIAPLTRAGLLKPLGTSPKYCVKRYSRDVLASQIVDVNWLDKIVDAMHKHWRKKNARKRAKQVKIQSRENLEPPLA